MGAVIRHRNIWAIRLPFDKGLFICWQGKDSYYSMRSWEWTKLDFLDHVGFEQAEKFFGKDELYSEVN